MNKNYENEVRERWGDTDVYREYSSKENNSETKEGLMAIFAEFAACRAKGLAADSEEAQQLVFKLKKQITENYYTCTDDILSELGKMYVADERFKKNIDKSGDGTAEFTADAISVYCS